MQCFDLLLVLRGAAFRRAHNNLTDKWFGVAPPGSQEHSEQGDAVASVARHVLRPCQRQPSLQRLARQRSQLLMQRPAQSSRVSAATLWWQVSI